MTIPFTPETLAERWHCSARHIRNLVHKGDLRGFRVGTMLRIPADEVERAEQCLTPDTASADSVEGSASSGTMPVEDGTVTRLTALRRAKLRSRRRAFTPS